MKKSFVAGRRDDNRHNKTIRRKAIRWPVNASSTCSVGTHITTEVVLSWVVDRISKEIKGRYGHD